MAGPRHTLHVKAESSTFSSKKRQDQILSSALAELQSPGNDTLHLTRTHLLYNSSASPWASLFKPPKRENNKIALRTCYRKHFLVNGLESQTRMETSHYWWTRYIAWLRNQPQDELTLIHAFVETCHNNNSLSLETSNAQLMASYV